MHTVEQVACYYIALIRSVYLTHQNNHWRTKGKNFYGNHLLFERIYKSAAEDADLAAEKLIGLFGDEVLDLQSQAEMIGKILNQFSSGDPVRTSLAIEKKFLDCSEKFYKLLKEDGDKLTLGLDDAIMSIASNREGAVYLLQQVDKEDSELNNKTAARIKLLRRIKKADLYMSNGKENFDVNNLHQKLLTELFAIVPSYVQGTYETNDLAVSIDLQNKRITATVKLPKPVAIEIQQKIENTFKQYTINILPPELQQNFMISVRFVMPPAKAYPKSY